MLYYDLNCFIGIEGSIVMLKSAIYCNVFILLVMSIFFMTRIFKKNSDLKKIRKLIIIYIIFNFISFYLCTSEIVDIGWDFIFLLPISIISFIIHIVSIGCINRKMKKLNNTDYDNLSVKKYIIAGIIPVIVFIIPYLYELYVINSCNYLLRYNHQNGIIQSDDAYIAIINNKPVSITLQKNLFNRKGLSTNELSYNIIYTNGIEISTKDSKYNKIIIENEDIKKIALDAKERCPSVRGAYIDYFSEGKNAIIVLMSEETHGTKLGEYFYYDSTYIKSINTHGSLESITYYK